MIGASTERAPHATVVVPHFVFSSTSFLVLSVLVLLAGSDMLGHYFQGKMLAITHLATLGWVSMVIFGALYQLIPVVLEVPLFSENLAKFTFGAFALSIVGLVSAFWMQHFGHGLLWASLGLLLSFVLFSINTLITALRAKKWSQEAHFIVASVGWFLLTGLLGFLLSLNFVHPLFSVSHLHLLKAHAHMGLLGWFLMLIMGVAAVLIPMFLLAHKLDKRKLRLAYWATQVGLVFYVVDRIWLGGNLALGALAIVVVGVLAFLSFLYEAYRKRARKRLDTGLKHTAVAMLLMLLPLPLAMLIDLRMGLGSDTLLRISTLYGASFLIGFISSLILGQYYKTLPFIVWLWRYQPYVGKFRTPLPKDLYSESWLKLQYWAYNLSLVAYFAGLVTAWLPVLYVGAALLVFTAVVFNLNVLRMLLHRVQLKDF